MLSKIGYFLALIISTSFGTGLIGRLRKGGGGLLGTLVGVLIIAVIRAFDGGLLVLLGVGYATFMLGLVCIGPAEYLSVKLFGAGRRHNGELVVTDLNETNIDEVLGMLVAALPAFIVEPNQFEFWLYVLVGFVLFRIFDTVKPGYIGRVDDRSGGSSFDIMLDDILAGGLAAVVVGVIMAAVAFGKMLGLA